jgi:hypothetical protein
LATPHPVASIGPAGSLLVRRKTRRPGRPAGPVPHTDRFFMDFSHDAAGFTVADLDELLLRGTITIEE